MFDTIDTDLSGEITKKEFRDSFAQICKDEEILKKRMNELDVNKDGEITFREFVFSISGWIGFFDPDDYELDER